MLSRIAITFMMAALPALAVEVKKDCETDSPLVAQANNLMKVADRIQDEDSNNECFNPRLLEGICLHVKTGLDIKESSPYYGSLEFVYEEKIAQAACVKPNDPPHISAQKIRGMWKKYFDPYFICDGDTDVQFGNILKMAVAKERNDFIENILYVWEVDLNHVDKVDKMTVLDYIEDKIKQLQKKPNAESKIRVLNSYKKILREKGAKYKKEL